MGVRAIVKTGSLVTTLLLCAALPVRAQGVGAIRGTVTDESGAVLPGASVVLTAAQGGLGSNQESITDARGGYAFSRLQPGTYSVRAELAGFRALVQPNVVVNADATARADLKLQIGVLEEAITVTSATPLLDTTSALKQTVLTREEQQALPNRTDVWAMARVIPGVVVSKIDVGGSDAWNASGIAVRGSGIENKYMVDGMDVSSPSGTATIANFYLDPFSFEEASFQAGAPGSADMSSGGLIMNMVTRSGTNTLRGGFKANYTPPAWANGRNYSDELRAQVLAGVPEKARLANPDLEPGNDIQMMNEVGGWLAGPLKRDKLWFALTGHDQRMEQYILGAYNPDGSQGLDRNVLWNVTGKVSWQVTQNAQLSYFNNTQYKLNGRFAGNERATFNEDRATQYVYKYPTVNQVKFTTPIGTSRVVDITYSRFRSDNAFTPQPGVQVGDIPTFDQVTSVGGVALPTTCPGVSCNGYYTTPLYREQIKAGLSWIKGGHDIKAGYEFVDITRDTRAWSISEISAEFANGAPVQARTYTMPVASEPFPQDLPVWFSYRGQEHGVYVQDRWALRRLTVNVGVRWETNESWEPAACMPASRFFAGQCYDKTTAPSFRDLAPRSSVVWDLLGNGRTVVKFGANRYNLPISVQAISNLNPITAPADFRQWLPQSRCNEPGVLGCDRNGDLTPQLSEIGPSPGYVFAGVNARYPDDIGRGVVNEYTVEFQRELRQGIVASIGYVHRETRKQWGQTNTAVPLEAWGNPITVTEVNSGETVQVWRRPSAASATLFSNDSSLDDNYDGIDVTLNKRLSQRWSMMSGATFSHQEQRTRGGNRNDPNIVYNAYDANPELGNGRPWSYRVSGVYELPYEISMSGTWMYMAGAPETTIVSVTGNTISLPQGSQAVVVRPVGDVRLPNQTTLDLSFRKQLRLGSGGQRLIPRVEIFNALNNATILGWLTTLGPTYHRPNSIQHGRLWKFEVAYDF
jgi:hypothetical protein